MLLSMLFYVYRYGVVSLNRPLYYASATFIAGTYTRSKAALYIEVPIS